MSQFDKLSLEEKREKVLNLRPIDDIFFEAIAEEREVCQEILQTIMQDKNLIVENSITQHNESNLYGRGVRLDALCTLGDGSKCNIEVQRSNNDNHLKRARFNASSITVRESNTGETFEEVISLVVVYISEFDFLHEGKTIYHIDKVVRETGQIVDDGLQEIFVNTTIDDGSDISALMSCFIKKEVNDPRFPALTKRVNFLKGTEKGLSSMSEFWRDYVKEEREEARTEGKEEGRAEGIAEGRIEGRSELLSNAINGGMSKETIISILQFTEEEYNACITSK